MHARFRTLPQILCLLAFIFASLAAPAIAYDHSSSKDMEAGSTKSLYDRLGGTYGIAAVIDDFTGRLISNEVVGMNVGIQKTDPMRLAGLKFQLTALMIQLTGGPYEYHGQDMKEAHKDTMVTEAQWDAGAAELKATLDAFEVPEAEQAELFALVTSVKGDIVVGEHANMHHM